MSDEPNTAESREPEGSQPETPSVEPEESTGSSTDGATPQGAAAEAATEDETKAAAPSPDKPTDKKDKKKDDPKAAAAKRRKPRNPLLLRAYRTGRPIEGKVQQVIKGGYEIRIGRARGFCPHSQMDVRREDEPERQVGQVYQFRVTQLRRGGDDVVVSRRALLEEERVEEAKAVRATLVEGNLMQGKVAGTAEFGAFVDLGAGVMGLVHLSEISHSRVARVDQEVKVGDIVRVKILKVDSKRGRISLSMRQAVDDPWKGIEERFQVAGVYPGTVLRVADFGAFLELAPGVEALAPAREFPPSAEGWNAGMEPGASREWYVLSVDAAQRRISVAPPGEGGTTDGVREEAELSGKIQRIEKYGLFVWLGPGKIGLLPRGWSGADAGTPLERRFRVGEPIDVTVVEVTEGGRRIRLAKKGVDHRAEAEARPQHAGRPKRGPRKPAPEPTPQPEQETGTFGTNLADKLKAALDRNRQS